MDMRWLLTEKEDGEGNVRHKARWICRGFQSRRDCETYAGTPAWKHLRTMLVLAASRGWELATVDVKGAFLQARTAEDSHICVRLDDGMPRLPAQNAFPEIVSDEEWRGLRAEANELKPGQVRRLKKALYGDKESPRRWKRDFRSSAEALGFQEVAESVEIRRGSDLQSDAAMLHHIDDIVITALDTAPAVSEICDTFQCNTPQVLAVGESVKFTGFDLAHTVEGFTLSSDGYLAQQPAGGAAARGDIVDKQLERGDNEVTDMRLKHEYAHTVGKIGWAVTHTRPDQMVYFCRLSEQNQQPTAQRLAVAKRVLQALKETPSELSFQGVQGHPVLVRYSDAGYNGVSKKARLGFKIYVLDQDMLRAHGNYVNLIDWDTSRAARRVASSSAAELFAFKEMVKRLFEHVDFVTELWGMQPQVRVRTDCAALVLQIQSGVSQSEPGLQGELDYVVQETTRLHAVVEQIPRNLQLADAMTKAVWFGRRAE
eukprot:GHVU01210171.1.p1 GENE.GHVU01210171.1~~GHVU01210171.1.p1  ORF type:complete len:485 (+),score=63.85 GHVU01210171.1:369-1823(+)